MFCSKYEERVSAIKVLLVLGSANPIGVAVRQEVLRIRLSALCNLLQQANGLLDELFL
jgi:hypothetical protein